MFLYSKLFTSWNVQDNMFKTLISSMSRLIAMTCFLSLLMWYLPKYAALSLTRAVIPSFLKIIIVLKTPTIQTAICFIFSQNTKKYSSNKFMFRIINTCILWFLVCKYWCKTYKLAKWFCKNDKWSGNSLHLRKQHVINCELFQPSHQESMPF